ncbi:hypothetical protein BJX76DRAFT_329218 [Aspergillus varians]
MYPVQQRQDPQCFKISISRPPGYPVPSEPKVHFSKVSEPSDLGSGSILESRPRPGLISRALTKHREDTFFR